MKAFRLFVVVAVLTTIIFSCTNNTSEIQKNTTVKNRETAIQNKNKRHRDIKTGVIRKFSTGKYNAFVYIPETANIDSADILLMFDPHADGKFCVNKYKKTARKYGVVLIASENSKNGLAEYEYSQILKELSDFAKQNFNINTLSAAGFSGGGKVASLLLLNNNIDVLVTAGAGLADNSLIAKLSNTKYFMFAGIEDFNMPDLLFLQKNIERSGINSLVETFDGTHQWPPEILFEDVFVSIKLKSAQKLNNINLVNKLTNAFLEIKKQMLKACTKIEVKHQILKSIVFILNDYYDVSEYEKQLIKITSGKEYQKYISQQNSLFQKETNLKQNYAQAIAIKDIQWWKTEIKELNKKADNTTNGLVYKRLINYLSLVCYMYVDKSIKTNNKQQALHFLQIYKIIDPENPDVEKFAQIIDASDK